MKNKDIRSLEDDILTLLNSSPVEMEVKRLILKEILSIVNAQAEKIIIQELNEEQNNAEST